MHKIQKSPYKAGLTTVSFSNIFNPESWRSGSSTVLSVIKLIVERNDNVWGRTFDIGIQLLIVLSIVTFSMETLPDLEHDTREWLGIVEMVTVLIFTTEYLLRLLVADRRLGYVFSFYGIVDLLAILPFYILSGIDLQSLRVLRMLRLLRLMKILRYSNAIQRLSRAMVLVREEMLVLAIVTAILLYLAAVGIYYFENETQPEEFKSIFHSLWWATTTLTTVGYGDVYPVTIGGRIFTFVILMLGLGVIAIPAGLLASALSQVREEEEEQAKQAKKQEKKQKNKK